MTTTAEEPVPVILDTDIGGDIDDTWALAFLLRCPELDLKLVTTGTGDTEYRARIVARILETAGRTDIPIAPGINAGSDGPRERQEKWVEGYRLEHYPGTVNRDGVQALVDCIMGSPGPVTLVSIGPATNIGAALKMEPRISGKTRFVGMFGSIRYAHDGKDGAIAEYNVEQDIPSAQAVFSAPWASRIITPLDTCGRVRLGGDEYARIRACADPLTRAVIENYRIWASAGNGDDYEKGTSILYDTVAVYLAFSETLLGMENTGIRVTDDGFTRPDPSAQIWRCATSWKNQPGFGTLLTDRLTGKGR